MTDIPIHNLRSPDKMKSGVYAVITPGQRLAVLGIQNAVAGLPITPADISRSGDDKSTCTVILSWRNRNADATCFIGKGSTLFSGFYNGNSLRVYKMAMHGDPVPEHFISFLCSQFNNKTKKWRKF